MFMSWYVIWCKPKTWVLIFFSEHPFDYQLVLSLEVNSVYDIDLLTDGPQDIDKAFIYIFHILPKETKHNK